MRDLKKNLLTSAVNSPTALLIVNFKIQLVFMMSFSFCCSLSGYNLGFGHFYPAVKLKSNKNPAHFKNPWAWYHFSGQTNLLGHSNSLLFLSKQ
jgi:hypothetical protein